MTLEEQRAHVKNIVDKLSRQLKQEIKTSCYFLDDSQQNLAYSRVVNSLFEQNYAERIAALKELDKKSEIETI